MDNKPKFENGGIAKGEALPIKPVQGMFLTPKQQEKLMQIVRGK